MNEPHPLGVFSSSQEKLESVDPKFLVKGLVRARDKTVRVLEEIKSRLVEGMTEDDARKIGLEIFKDAGVTKHWHKPVIRFGPGTALTFHSPLQPAYRLQPNDPYYLDLGPVWPDSELDLEYEGDYGDTFVFGKNSEAEKCAQVARVLFDEGKKLWREKKVTGAELYQYLDRRTTELGYVRLPQVDGHRVGDFPHQKYSKEGLSKVPFVPTDSLWILEIQINDPQNRFGAFFEDIL